MASVIKLRQQIVAEQAKIRRQVGENLRSYREDRKLTQEQLSELVGIERTAVSNMEGGKQNVTLEQLLNFCEVFEVSPNEFLSGVGHVV